MIFKTKLLVTFKICEYDMRQKINREQFHKGIRWKVGDGTNINFSHNNWCDNENLVNICGVTDTSLLDTTLKVSDMIYSTKEWDVANSFYQYIFHLVQLQILSVGAFRVVENCPLNQ